MNISFKSPRRPKPVFEKYAILLTEDKEAPLFPKPLSPYDFLQDFGEPNELLITKVGMLLQAKIKAHTNGLDAEICNADNVIAKNPPTLIPIMYRIACEGFIKSSKAIFKIIELRNVSKLVSDWKPTLPDILNGLQHQVIVVQLKESFKAYNDFVYSVLRQLDHDWKIRLPRSFFYPDDVCTVDGTKDRQIVVVTPSMPDGDLEISDKVNYLSTELLKMLTSSCLNSMENHLLMKDLRVGKFSDTLTGVSTLRHIYRTLRSRLQSGKNVKLGPNSEDLKNYMKSAAGETIMSAEALLEACKQLSINEVNLDEEEEAKEQETPLSPLSLQLPPDTESRKNNENDIIDSSSVLDVKTTSDKAVGS